MAKHVADRLTRLLEVERAALLRGDLEGLGDLTAEKQALASELESLDAAEIAGLSSALAHNQKLIAAARDGVMSVVARLSERKAARTMLSTYDATGKAAKILRPVRTTERRY